MTPLPQGEEQEGGDPLRHRRRRRRHLPLMGRSERHLSIEERNTTGNAGTNFGVMARKDISMTPEERADFLESGRTLIVTSLDKNGGPHTAPMWYFVDHGKIVFRSFTKSQKIVNLRRDPRITVLVERGIAYAELQAVMIQGTARLVDGSSDPAYLLELYRRLAARYPMLGPNPVELTPDALEAAFGRFAPKNTAVIVEPRRIVSWDHRKLGGGY